VTPPVCAGFEFDEMISESLREVNAIGISVACWVYIGYLT